MYIQVCFRFVFIMEANFEPRSDCFQGNSLMVVCNISYLKTLADKRIEDKVSHGRNEKGSGTVKPVLSGHSKRRTKIGFQDRLSLNAGLKYCRMLQESILQYFRPSLSYHLSLRPLFWLFMSGRLRQVLLYILMHISFTYLASIYLVKWSHMNYYTGCSFITC